MLDLYTVIVPLLALTTALTLLILKLAIKDNMTMSRIHLKNTQSPKKTSS